MSRKKLIAGNWKMNKTVKEAVSLAKELKKLVKGAKGKDVAVCPAATALSAVSSELKGSNIKVGAQNMHFEDSGAFTGEISPLMVKELCKYVIVGHSERRAYFGEDNLTVNKKVKKALEAGLTPIVCVGEKLDEREAGKTRAVVENHITGALKGLAEKDVLKLVIAYEPVWAIGTGRTATPEQAEEVHAYIRELVNGMYGKEASGRLRILYGGSVKAANAGELLAKGDIDGALVGGASLKADEFSKIVKS